MKTQLSSQIELYKNTLSKLIGSILFMLITANVYAQEERDKWFGMISLNEGYRINEDVEWSTPGLNYELFFRLSESFGLQSKTGFLFWKDADMDSYYTMIGVHYNLLQTGGFDVLAYGNAGTSAIIGNDYAAFFGMVETGIKLLPKRHKNINASISWNQNMAFYDPTISYVAVSVGYVF